MAQTTLHLYATIGEAHYCRKLVANILSRGWYISVNDGEEWTVRHSRKRSEILGAMATTGYDVLRMSDMDERSLGSFYIVYGNDPSGEEIISDCSGNALCEKIYDEVMGTA